MPVGEPLMAKPVALKSPITVTVSPFGGFTGTVTVSAANLPSGVTVVPTANSSNVATLTFRADNTAALGATTINIVGTSGTYSAQVQVVLSVI